MILLDMFPLFDSIVTVYNPEANLVQYTAMLRLLKIDDFV